MGPDVAGRIASFLCAPFSAVAPRFSGNEAKPIEAWRYWVGNAKAPFSEPFHGVVAGNVRIGSVRGALYNTCFDPDRSVVSTETTTSGIVTSRGLADLEDIAVFMKEQAATPNRKVRLVLYVTAAEYPNRYFLAKRSSKTE